MADPASPRRDVAYPSADGSPLLASLVVPPGATPAPIAVLVHGGAWQRGGPADFDEWAQVLAAHGIASLAAPYRHASTGQPSWPGCRDDVLAAVAFVVDRGADLGVDPTRLVLMGTSAGAHLISLVQLSGGADARLVVALNGVYDLVEQFEHAERAGDGNSIAVLMGGEPGDLADAFRAASPVQWVGAGRAARARWLVVWGDADSMVPPSTQSVPFAAALQAAGAEVEQMALPGVGHLWHTATPVDEGPNLRLQAVLWHAIDTALAPV
jgi:acetyl esterase/lipase